MAAEHPDTDPRQVARDALISSVAQNLGMIAVLVAVNVVVAKREAITRQLRRAQAAATRKPDRAHEARELAEFRRDIADISHDILPRLGTPIDPNEARRREPQ
jgi:hypothetical protein